MFLNFIYSRIQKIKKRKNPIKYWRNKGVKIGKECEINPGASFGSEPYLISIGNHVRVNIGVNFITHDGGCWVFRTSDKINNAEKIDLFGEIRVGNNVHIGSNSFIMPGVTIGDNCIIGCCAVVTKDIPNNSVAAGIPARVIESIDDYYLKHQKDFSYIKHFDEIEKKKYLLKIYNKEIK